MGEDDFFNNLLRSYAEIPDRNLLDMNLMTTEAEELLTDTAKEKITTPSRITSQMDKVLDIFNIPENDNENFIKADSPIVQEWLRIVRGRLATMNQLERHFFNASVAYRVLNDMGATDVSIPVVWLKGRIEFPPVRRGEGRIRLTGGVGFANSPQGVSDFVKHINTRWNALITLNQKHERPARFKQFFTDPFPYTLDKYFRANPVYAIAYNNRTKNIRVIQIKDDDPNLRDILYYIPIRRWDYNEFFKSDTHPPAQKFSEMEVRSPSASPSASPRASGRVRRKKN